MANGSFCEHFGGAKEFLIFEGSCRTGQIECREAFSAPEHKPGSLPEWLATQKVDVVVASAIGERALISLASNGIEVRLSEGTNEVSELAEKCLSGSLVQANGENSRCKGEHHHDEHECDHHH